MDIDFSLYPWYNLIMNTTDKITNPYKSVTTDALFARKQEILSMLPGFDLAHVMRASLITRSVKCGKPNCRCANGEGHKSLYLSSFPSVSRITMNSLLCFLSSAALTWNCSGAGRSTFRLRKEAANGSHSHVPDRQRFPSGRRPYLCIICAVSLLLRIRKGGKSA